MTSTITYEGDLRTNAEHLQSGSSIETDAPLDNQGKAERFSPTDLVVTALGSCMMTIMGIKARDLAVDLRGLKIDITKHMAAEPRRISGIDVTLRFPGGLTLEDKQRTILERAALTCPVFQSIHPAIVVDTKFVY
jgi:putative redox protein